MVAFAEAPQDRMLQLRKDSLISPEIQIALTPQDRKAYLAFKLGMDGLGHIQEDAHAAYCPISLTNTPEALKPFILERQNILKDTLLKAGITAYDPATAPYSPDTNLTATPDEVYLVDSSKIAGARFFVGHNLLPSSGQGIESEKAKDLIRVPVILMDRRIRVSRMQPSRAIYLAYKDFKAQRQQFVDVFTLLQQFEPGVGFHKGASVLLGFTATGEVVDLQETVYSAFPSLQYDYDGNVPTAKLAIENPEIFSELKRTT